MTARAERTRGAPPPSLPRAAPVLAPIVASLLAGCSGAPPESLGGLAEGLAPCPSAPNCVHTAARHPAGTPQVRLADPWVEAPVEELHAELLLAVGALPRTRISTVEMTSGPGGGLYLRAEARSRVFRFVDDLELRRVPNGRELEIRSASRAGGSDMGVNARRVDTLRELLVERGVAER
jgi:uncharacterized protein (DUF1499 family)